GVLVYFSNAHISTDKTQGAIGQRDVYRDGQVNSADVATPGSAPVATEAILESSDFKSLAKNPAFQELLRDDAFSEMSRQRAFSDLLANSQFRAVAQDPLFLELVKSEAFQKSLKQDLKQDMRFEAFRQNARPSSCLRTNRSINFCGTKHFCKWPGTTRSRGCFRRHPFRA